MSLAAAFKYLTADSGAIFYRKERHFHLKTTTETFSAKLTPVQPVAWKIASQLSQRAKRQVLCLPFQVYSRYSCLTSIYIHVCLIQSAIRWWALIRIFLIALTVTVKVKKKSTKWLLVLHEESLEASERLLLWLAQGVRRKKSLYLTFWSFKTLSMTSPKGSTLSRKRTPDSSLRTKCLTNT